MRTWTPEARAAQRLAISRWKPWARSTGPRTTEGKARASRNACKGDTQLKVLRDLRLVFSLQRRFLQSLSRTSLKNPSKRTIIRTGPAEVHPDYISGLMALCLNRFKALELD